MPNASVRAAATGLPSSIIRPPFGRPEAAVDGAPEAIAARREAQASAFLDLEERVTAVHGAVLCLEHLFEDAVFGGRQVAEVMLKLSPICSDGYHVTAMTEDQVEALTYIVDQIGMAARALINGYRSSPTAEGNA